MDQQKNPGQGSQQDNQSNPKGQPNPNDRQPPHPTREPADGQRKDMPGHDQSTQQQRWTGGQPQQGQRSDQNVGAPDTPKPTEGGRGSSGERNRSVGISTPDSDQDLDTDQDLEKPEQQPTRGSDESDR